MARYLEKMAVDRGKNFYRGKGMDGEWYFGSLIHTTLGNTKTWISWSARGNGGWFNLMSRVYVKPDTVGQFIGRTDKKGNPIFEGDILRCYDKLDGIVFDGYVEYGNCSFRINSGFITHYRWMDYEVEVLGNIYDHPQLLEDK